MEVSAAMTILDIHKNRGAFIPFDHPVPAITSDPFASPDVGFCISYDWLPVVFGCLKTLQRPETWLGTADDIALACLQAQKLMAGYTEPCGGSSGIPFACPFDLSDSDTGWTVRTDDSLTPPERGVWTGGVGFQAQTASQAGTGYAVRGLGVYFDFGAALDITSVSGFYSWVRGNIIGPGFGNGLYLYNGATQVAHNTFDPYGHADEINQTLTVSVPPGTGVSRVYFDMFSSYSNIAVALGTVELYTMTFEGSGAAPVFCS